MAMPMRPWKKTRMMGHWSRRGDSILSAFSGFAGSEMLGLKISGSKARAMWVTTTETEASPLRPYMTRMVS